MELDLLSGLNDLLSSAISAAEAPWEPRLTKRQQHAAGSEEDEDMPGPGAYDVRVTAVGRRVVGGRWGSAPRAWKEDKGKTEVVPGPGAYDPNR